MYSLFKNIKEIINNNIYECKLLNYNTYYVGHGFTNDKYIFEISKQDTCNSNSKICYNFVCSAEEVDQITTSNLDWIFEFVSFDYSGEVYLIVQATISKIDIIISKAKICTSLKNLSELRHLTKNNGIIVSKSEKSDEQYTIQILLHTQKKNLNKYYNIPYHTKEDRERKDKALNDVCINALKKEFQSGRFQPFIVEELYNYIINNPLLS